MVNSSFLNKFSNASAEFQSYRISDHTPMLLEIPALIASKPRPFRLANFVTRNEKFRGGWMEG